ncbi:leucine-rich repeat-containing protein 71 [Pelodytes ibericus]
MGKKTEKSTKDRTNVGSGDEDLKSSAIGWVDRTSLTAEDYQCTGNLEQDFTELCYRVGHTEIPQVVARPLSPGSPGSNKTTNDDSEWTLDLQASTGQNTDRFSYFRPKINIELENDDPKSIKEITIRGWKIDDTMMGVLAKCLPSLALLHKISLWNVGLTDDTFSSFVAILHQCPSIRIVSFEGNALAQQSYYKLIAEELPLTQIYLRNNQIDEEGARLLCQGLKGLQVTNKNLAILNLAYNHVADAGACHFAKALRFSRVLLSLDLSNNRIGSVGAIALAEVLGPFALTHEEIVERRKVFLEKLLQEQSRSPAASRHADSKSERPPSHNGSNTVDKTSTSKTNKGAGKKKEKVSWYPKKEDKALTGSQANGSSGQMSQGKKEEAKGSKKQLDKPDPKSVRGKGTKSATKRPPFTEPENPEPTEEITNPLLELAESRDGKLFLSGNRTLLNLNLSTNNITESGVKAFLALMETQILVTKTIPGTKTPIGLLRLSLGKNTFSSSSGAYRRLLEIMRSRDPMNKSSTSSVEEQT